MARKVIPRGRVGLLLGLLLLTLGFLFLPARSRDNPVSRAVLSLAAGGHQFVRNVVHGLASVWTDYLFLVDARQENLRLRARVAELSESKTRLMELTMENARLRQLLGFKAKTPLPAVPAQVVGRDPTNWFKSVLINKGKKDGVAPRAAVVTHAGLVGRVIELGERAAKVLLVTDQASRVAVLIQRTRAEGIVAGDGRESLRVEYLSRLADVRVGDVVISSGLGGVFPKGLKVGEVIAVEKKDYGLFQTVRVAPGADLSRLEEVLVLQREGMVPPPVGESE